jgi:hypothetical protein
MDMHHHCRLAERSGEDPSGPAKRQKTHGDPSTAWVLTRANETKVLVLDGAVIHAEHLGTYSSRAEAEEARVYVLQLANVGGFLAESAVRVHPIKPQ